MVSNYLNVNHYGIYRFRIKIPKRLLPFFKVQVLTRSLHTKDNDTAITKARFLYNEFTKVIKVVDMNLLNDSQINQLVNNFIKHSLDGDMDYRLTTNNRNVDYEIDVLEDLLYDAQSDLSSGNIMSYKDLAEDVLDKLGLTFDKNNMSHKYLLQRLVIAKVEILEEAKNRAIGKYADKYLNIATDSLSQNIAKPKTNGKTVSEAISIFKKYYTGESAGEATKGDTYYVLNNLEIMLGANTSICDVDIEDMLDVKDTILRLPRMNLNKYKNKSFYEILQLLDTVDESEIISNSRAKDYIKHISKFFKYLYDTKIITHNPTTRLSIDAGETEKESFSDAEIVKLLDIINSILDDKKYLYLSYIYTGMRREEIYNSTIETVDGVKCFRVNKGKNIFSKRLIPVHSKLIEAGITNEILENAKELIGHKALGRYFNEVIKPKITDSSHKTLHSLRHTVATKLVIGGVDQDIIKSILGHTKSDMLSAVYARGVVNVCRLQEAIEKLFQKESK